MVRWKRALRAQNSTFTSSFAPFEESPNLPWFPIKGRQPKRSLSAMLEESPNLLRFPICGAFAQGF